MSHEFDSETYIGCDCVQCTRLRQEDLKKQSTKWEDRYDTTEDCPHCLEATAKTILAELNMMKERALAAEARVGRRTDAPTIRAIVRDWQRRHHIQIKPDHLGELIQKLEARIR